MTESPATSPPAPAEQQTEEQKRAIEQSLQEKKDLSYYHAHNRPREDLSQAKKLEGKNLCNPDGNPEKLDEKDERYFPRLAAARDESEPVRRIKKVEKYMFEDGNKNVKLHVDFEDPEILKQGTVTVTYQEDGLGMELNVLVEAQNTIYRFLVRDQPFHAKILPDKNSYKVSSDKCRLVFKLIKENDQEPWPQLLEKKMNKHTGWGQ
ncbi:unnamed protein product [Amoebophrya sp. A120]|nr:unnamed protein product [Amoebophrya sp. A120]|eukprot:GSA120T00023708001.1